METTKWLKYQFTENELKEIARKLAYENKNFDELEEGKKAVTSEFKSKTDASRASISKLSNYINNGYEMRVIDCKVEFNDPENGQKTVYRKDTGELVEVLEMSHDEMQEKLEL
jgi:hypothetical protein